MITKFKLFESEEKETTFVIDDLISYSESGKWLLNSFSKGIIYNFISQLFSNITLVKFYCKNLTKKVNGETFYIPSNKINKGEIEDAKCGINFLENNWKISLSINLKRTQYTHEVDTSQPITIYGEIPIKLKSVIDNINMIRTANKYNI